MSTLTQAQREALAKRKRGGRPRKYNTPEEIQQAQEARRIKDREAKRQKRSLSRSPAASQSTNNESHNTNNTLIPTGRPQTIHILPAYASEISRQQSILIESSSRNDRRQGGTARVSSIPQMQHQPSMTHHARSNNEYEDGIGGELASTHASAPSNMEPTIIAPAPPTTILTTILAPTLVTSPAPTPACPPSNMEPTVIAPAPPTIIPTTIPAPAPVITPAPTQVSILATIPIIVSEHDLGGYEADANTPKAN